MSAGGDSSRKDELYFENLGEDFDRFMSEFDVEQRIRLIRKLAHASQIDLKTQSCLELGCGTGKISSDLFEYFGDLTVSDLSEKLTNQVSSRLGCSGQASDALNLKFESDQFDFIVSSEMIEHTPDPEKALQEMVRVTKPGGMIIVTSPNLLWYPVLWLSVKLGLRKFQGNEVWLSPKKAASILEKAGCEIREIGGCHLFPWQIPGAKRILPKFNNYDKTLYPLMINWGIWASKK